MAPERTGSQVRIGGGEDRGAAYYCRCDLRNGAESNARNARVRRLIALAYVLAISIPPLGLALGVAVSLRFGRQHLMHGLAVITLGVIASIVWVLVLTSGTLNTPPNGY